MRIGRVLVAVIGTMIACAGGTPAHAAGLETVLQDDAQLLHRSDEDLRRSLEELRLLGVDRIRVTAGWSVLTRDADTATKPAFDATDPSAYEQDRWRNLDRLLVLAREHGFSTMIDIAFWAPKWASQDPVGQRGRTNVDAEEFRRFAIAVVRRYSGSFVIPRTLGAGTGGAPAPSRDARYLDALYGTSNPPSRRPTLHQRLGMPTWLRPDTADVALVAALGTSTLPATRPLPRAEVFTLWNEPNHPSFLRPQWERAAGGRPVPRSPHLYRELVARAYPAIKEIRPEATVLIGATAAYGTYRSGTGNVPPLRFLRELACVNRRLRPLRRSGCDAFQPVPGDGWSHHPYTLRTEPDAPAPVNHPDDVPLADLPKLARLLDRLIAAGRLAPATRNLWITEYGYETAERPTSLQPWTQGDQAKFIPWSEYMVSRVPGVRTFAQFLLRDLPGPAFDGRRRASGQWHSGLLLADGAPKLGAYAFIAGLFAQELPDGRLRLWGRLRVGGGAHDVVLERRPPRSVVWEPVGRLTVGGDDSFEHFAAVPEGRGWRYRLRYRTGLGWRAQPSVAAVSR